jgi:8-amino-3,8-dideoxy-alpha-D-manno-octulosonate transaminase
MRKYPFGAAYLDWADVPELRAAVESRTLFRWLAPDGGQSAAFEADVRQRLATSYALATPSCTQAIRVALLATRPRAGDLVYLPAVTFVATAGAVLSAGLIPVLVDVTEDLVLDPALLPPGAERVVVVHLEGTVAPVPDSVPYALEDCAQAMAATHPDGRHVGTVGYAGVFSFNHNKLLSSGEGGLIVTDDEDRYALMRSYHDHGSSRVQGQYPTWRPEAFYGENLVANEAVTALQRQQLRHVDEIRDGLQRHYELTLAELPDRPYLRVVERGKGDVKVSVKLELESRELRDRAQQALVAADLPVWTLERYFLPEHPVVTARRSIYADGFPWNLAPAGALGHSRDGFAGTRDRLGRTLCLRLAPELSESEQSALARRARDILAGL